MENKQPTPRDIAISTLENKVFQGIVSKNQILKNQFLYGKLAVNGAENTNELMNSEEARKVRDNLYKKAKEKGDRLGVYGEPSITDYAVSTDVIEQIEENKSRLSLGDLEGIVKSLGKDFGYDFEMPKELEKYIPAKLQEKMQIAAIKASGDGKKINPEDVLTEEEMKALDVYEFLSESYNRGVSLKACNYFADLNRLGAAIKEKYQPKESKE